MLDAVEVRLECLKLAYRHDRSPEDSVKAAKELEAYVLQSTSGAKAPVGRPSKAVNPLS